MGANMTDTEALRAIHNVLNYTEWSSETLEHVAAIVQQAGYVIHDCAQVDPDPDYDSQGNLRAGG
jgi:hypothetical protein